MKNKAMNFLPSVMVTLFGFWIFSPMLNGRLGLIDDHEFLRFLKIGGQNLANIPAMLASTEIANFGDTARFRPAYYSLRALETVIHGTDGTQWYLWRVSFFAIFLFGSTFLFHRLLLRSRPSSPIFNGIASLAAGLMLATLPAWADIVMRLGPSEMYLALGTLLIGVGAFYALAKDQQITGLGILTLGFWLSVGSKENSLSYLWPVFFIILLLFLRGLKWYLASFFLALNLVAVAYVGLGFLPSVLGDGQDVYGAQRTVSGWMSALFGTPHFWITLAATAFSLILWRRISTDSLPTKLVSAGLVSTPVVLTITDAYFYQYSIQAGSFVPARYGIVIEMMSILSIVILVTLARGASFTKSESPRAIAVTLAAALALLPASQVFSASQTRSNAEQNASYLNYQFQALQAVSDSIEIEGVTQILYISDEPYDYERINASRQYFEVLSGKPVQMFLWTDYSNVAFDQFTLPLAEELERWSVSGNSEWELNPLADLDQEKLTKCVHFGGDPTNSPCNQSQWIGG